jgi:alkylation response protein AidB-like acyl-CoA dehydrogenase
VDATSQAMQLWGWRGIDARFASEKRFRDARQTTIYEGTSEIQAMNLFRSFVRDARLLP